jgi:hypothetical protein
MTPPAYQQLIGELALAVGQRHDGDHPEPPDPTLDLRDATVPQPTVNLRDVADATPTDGPRTSPTPTPPPQPPDATTASEPPSLPRPEALEISAGEREHLGQLARLVPTPRAAKRLVNTYRMLRVSVPHDELANFLPSAGDEQGGNEYQAVVVLLGILIGRPAVAHDVFSAIANSPDDADIWTILGPFADVHEQLAPLRQQITVTDAAPYRHWVPRVSRFSFRLGAVIPLDAAATQPTPSAYMPNP